MIIADLNYLEITSEEVIGGTFGYGYGDFDIDKDVDIDIDINEDLNIDKNVDVDVNISGNLATAESGATALGNNSFAETFAFTFTNDGVASSNSLSVAGTN
ncbi:hypothetical protein [Nostoc sp. CALU 1950]|uniref:hypothetical protein n=1 Tax=Nostoc sp. CALU 1950 TaxID=3104321 RepID=UPI003EBE40B5